MVDFILKWFGRVWIVAVALIMGAAWLYDDHEMPQYLFGRNRDYAEAWLISTPIFLLPGLGAIALRYGIRTRRRSLTRNSPAGPGA
jgi:hypothetical protein